MSFLLSIGVLCALFATFAIINTKTLKLADGVGTTAVGVMFSIALMVIGVFFPAVTDPVKDFMQDIDFTKLMFDQGLLCALLFAGAMHVNASKMKSYLAPILLLASVGVVVTAGVVGYGTWLVFQLIGWNDISLWWCFVFGAIIAPTDPIAVIGVLTKSNARSSIEQITLGEAMINDATAVVMFLTLVKIAGIGNIDSISYSSIGHTLYLEVTGGLFLGLLVGMACNWLMKHASSYPAEMMITFAAALVSYGAAQLLHVSAPLAVVIAGVFVGNVVANHSMTAENKDKINQFWTGLDELLNLALFGLIGMELIVIELTYWSVFVGFLIVPVVLIARFITIEFVLRGLGGDRSNDLKGSTIMTWAGLRGGISIALVLSLPAFPGKDHLIGVTYFVVVFSLLVQATTLGALIENITNFKFRKPAPKLEATNGKDTTVVTD